MNIPEAEVGVDGSERPTLLVRLGLASWSVVGLVAVAALVLLGLAAVSEVAIPVLMGAFVGVVVKPAADALRRRGLQPTAAAALVLVAMLAVLVGVTVGVARGLTSQSDEISASMDDAVSAASDQLGVDLSLLHDAREAVGDLGPLIGPGSLTSIVSGVGAVVGFVSGLLLATIVLYYVIKDGTLMRARLVARVRPRYREDLDDFFGESFRTMRSYSHGRTVLSAIVTVTMGITSALLGLPLILSIMAVTFIGGYIPYIGAFVAGAFTVLIALGDGGVGPAVVILIVSLAANLLLENFVQPKVMGETLRVHPLQVLIVTALGGLAGGVIGLVVAVPLSVIAGSAFTRLQASGHLERAAAKARPAAEKLLGGSAGSSADRADRPAAEP